MFGLLIACCCGPPMLLQSRADFLIPHHKRDSVPTNPAHSAEVLIQWIENPRRLPLGSLSVHVDRLLLGLNPTFNLGEAGE
jgi:hypothetical protein